MSESDPHAPTSAGPDPASDWTVSADPTPVVNPSEASWRQPPGSAMLDGAEAGAPDAPKPEVLLGAAFAGGLLAGVVLKRLTRGGDD